MDKIEVLMEEHGRDGIGADLTVEIIESAREILTAKVTGGDEKAKAVLKDEIIRLSQLGMKECEKYLVNILDKATGGRQFRRYIDPSMDLFEDAMGDIITTVAKGGNIKDVLIDTSDKLMKDITIDFVEV